MSQFAELSADNRDKIDEYLKSLPLTIELNGYTLVHAGITATRRDEEFCVWAREEFLNVPTGLDKTVLLGHRLTSFITGEKPMKIWSGDGRIGIDCGACFKGCQLGCLPMDDMESETYPKQIQLKPSVKQDAITVDVMNNIMKYQEGLSH